MTSATHRVENASAPPLGRNDPRYCLYCGEPFILVIGCHKICRCGYQEGCGD